MDMGFREFMEKDSTKKVMEWLKNAGYVLKLTSKWAYKLRSLLLSIPVFVCAVALAIRNLQLLPEFIVIPALAADGDPLMVARSAAVLIPVLLTVFSLMLMLCSKKVLYPWLVSVFSLVLPLTIWLISMFPT